mmetsp:Transcript_38982/g.81842  ORF Transcript_38982/g.81842 Transcript_38982/m.81842 type:complete len:220 (-) Transcript_38982:193-852(-)
MGTRASSCGELRISVHLGDLALGAAAQSALTNELQKSWARGDGRRPYGRRRAHHRNWEAEHRARSRPEPENQERCTEIEYATGGYCVLPCGDGGLQACAARPGEAAGARRRSTTLSTFAWRVCLLRACFVSDIPLKLHTRFWRTDLKREYVSRRRPSDFGVSSMRPRRRVRQTLRILTPSRRAKAKTGFALCLAPLFFPPLPDETRRALRVDPRQSSSI